MWPPSPALLNTNTSYPEPIAIPSSQPGDSPTFCVPINEQWIPIVAGSLQQLAQTNIWSGMTEAEALAAVGAAWDLIAAVANASACTVFELQFTMGCTLQYSTDGGSTWTDVPGWDAYFASCVGGSTGGGGGAPPPDITLDGATLACNMAGYLVQTLLRQAITQVVDKIVASGVIEDVIDTIIAIIPGIDATMPLVIAATDALFSWVGANLSYFVAGAISDLVWSKIGCIIYQALNPFVGWTATALANLVSAITGATVAPSQVLTAIANYLSALGVPALQSITAPAYLTMYNCSMCSMPGDTIDITSAPTLQQIPNLTITDGTTSITPTQQITIVGGRVSGTSPNAVVTLTGGGGGGGGSALLEQTGTVSITIPAGSSDQSASVTFPDAFSGTPAIVVSSDTENVVCSVQSASTTGFTATITALTALAAGDPITAVVTWIATTGGSGGQGSVPFVYTTPPDITTWTWTNQGTASIVGSVGTQAIAAPGTFGDNWRLLTIAAPATPYTITAAFVFNTLLLGVAFGGVVLRDSGAGKFINWGIDNQSGYEIGASKWDGVSSYNSDYGRTSAPMAQVIWFQVVNDGTNLAFNVSNDGANWFPYVSEPVGDFLTTIDQIGIAADANTGTWPVWLTLLSWSVS